MKLLLTSAGISNDTIKNKFFQMIGKKPEDIILAYIPTAANNSVGDKSWMTNNLDIVKGLGLARVDTVDFSAIPKSEWLSHLERVDVLYFEGGDPTYLAEEMIKSGFTDSLSTALKNKLYVGCSAGSMVVGEEIIKSSKNDLGYRNTKGFGLVDFSIRPHFNRGDRGLFTTDFIAELAKKFSTKFYAIDDNSAIAVEDGIVEVISEGEYKEFK